VEKKSRSIRTRRTLLLEEVHHRRRATTGVLSARATTATVKVEPATGVGTAVSGWRSTGAGRACPSRPGSAPSARWEAPRCLRVQLLLSSSKEGRVAMSVEDVGGCCWGYSRPCCRSRDPNWRRRERRAVMRRRRRRAGSESRRLAGLKWADWSEGGLDRWGGVGSSTGGGATRAFPSVGFSRFGPWSVFQSPWMCW
jgi:hypothetical protein